MSLTPQMKQRRRSWRQRAIHHQQMVGGAGVAISNSLSSITTDASTTPTTEHLTLGVGRNAVRVFTSDQVPSETHFFLYVRINGGTAIKIKCYGWYAPILYRNGSGAALQAGDSISFGTADGRAIKAAALTVPDVLESSFGDTGTANCDKSGPPFWTPAAAHITLAAENSAFKFVDTSSTTVHFIREYDPASGTWTPTRWVRTQSGRDTIVRCQYKRIAIANMAGATASVAAPTGATIGGTSVQTHNPFMPTVTGASRNCNSVATFKTAMAAAVFGDEVVMESGTYVMDASTLETTFAANNGVGGKTGMEGVRIRGATGVASDVVITGDGSSTNGKFDINGGTGLYGGFKDLKFNFASMPAGVQLFLDSGKWALENVEVTGTHASATDSFTFRCGAAQALNLYAFWCSFTDGSDDLVNGDGNAAQNANSRAVFFGCTASDAGPNSDHQCFTSHNGLTVEWYGGSISDANSNVIASDGASTLCWAGFATISKGARTSGLDNSTVFGCDIDGRVGASSGATTIWLFNHISVAAGATNGPFRNQALTCQHNFVLSSTGDGRGIFNSNDTGDYNLAGWNIYVAFDDGIRTGSSTGAGGTNTHYGNTVVNHANGLWNQDANILVTWKNNAVKGSTNGVNVTATSMGKTTTNYNTIDPTIDADFVAGANDITNADAALDAFYFPTASGNCDGNGDTTIVDYIGDQDPWGYDLIYKSTRVSRGARDRAALHSGAVIHPSYF